MIRALLPVVLFLVFALAVVGGTAVAQQADGPLCNGLAITVLVGQGQTPTDGDDVIAGTPERDVINAGAGNDTICGLGENDSIFGGSGNDTIVGGPGHDILTGVLATTSYWAGAAEICWWPAQATT